MKQCKVQGCDETVGNPKGYLCLSHWKEMKNGQVRKCEGCGEWWEGSENTCPKCPDKELAETAASAKPLTATSLGKHLGVSAQRVNLILAELGWIEKGPGGKGWEATRLGADMGAHRKESSSGVPYVFWPVDLLEDSNFLASVRDVKGEQVEPEDPTPPEKKGFREKFPASYRTMDGHMVRSRAEAMIDNWLYTSKIAHAVERKLPIEEEVYCDFYIPAQKVYIEFWGMEGQPHYDERKKEKLAIYKRYGFHLVELNDEDVASLDDALPRKLLKFGVAVD